MLLPCLQKCPNQVETSWKVSHFFLVTKSWMPKEHSVRDIGRTTVGSQYAAIRDECRAMPHPCVCGPTLVLFNISWRKNFRTKIVSTREDMANEARQIFDFRGAYCPRGGRNFLNHVSAEGAVGIFETVPRTFALSTLAKTHTFQDNARPRLRWKI